LVPWLPWQRRHFEFVQTPPLQIFLKSPFFVMPCEVVRKRVDFFKMAAVAMETTKMLKK
jgi:hypothetical protein